MDTKIVRYILCRMLGVEAALLLVPVLVAVIYQEKCGIVFLIPIVILCLLFWVVGRKRPEHGQIYRRIFLQEETLFPLTLSFRLRN